MGVIMLLLLASSFTVFASPTPPPLHSPPPPFHIPVDPPLHAHSPPPPHPHSPPPPHPHSPPPPSPFHPPVEPPLHAPRPHYHHHHHPPAHAPFHPPPPPPPPPPHVPFKPHVPPPPPHFAVHPPRPFLRLLKEVQGVVYVKSCKYANFDTLLEAPPVLGAVVELRCYINKHKYVVPAKTDKNGYFLLQVPISITTSGVHNCKVFLVSAPGGLKPTNLNGGVTGGVLRAEKPGVERKKLPYVLYDVGPFAFEPKCPR
ncbi:non-classical arabinogalactan protein 31-like [Gastrolobium bilobum]|uniref:non-classical arabinogalactan protein 31-like n=1 Tax=Gastrolobium bilobum TaxID=150636 RepID=UPI002AAFE1F4|nr:non-classical arabinogalactan protein 31-like [Gastrolobium bilobum]